MTVLPTHRRRGILNTDDGYASARGAWQRRDFCDAGRVGEHYLWPRYGYGIASIIERWSIDRRHTDLAYAPESPGRLAIHRQGRCGGVAAIGCRARLRRQAGVCPATFLTTGQSFSPTFEQRAKRIKRFPLRHCMRRKDEIDGYVIYRLDGRHCPGNRPDGWQRCGTRGVCGGSASVLISERRLSATTAQWTTHCPWMLADPTQVAAGARRDGMWLRILDVQKALEARTYAREGSDRPGGPGRVLPLERWPI